MRNFFVLLFICLISLMPIFAFAESARTSNGKDAKVYVLGYVNKQGCVKFDDVSEMSLLKALALSGGFERKADLRSIKIKRISSTNNVELKTIDLKKILNEPIEDFKLESGDIIYVPEVIF